MKIKIILFSFFIFASSLFSQNINMYLWETPINYNSNAPDYMVQELRKEIDTLLKYNSWAPLRVYFGDIIWETYFSYLEPARVILTLARAYNHLTPAQRTQVGNYIRAELSDPVSSPWVHIQNAHLDRTIGKRREYHMLDSIWGADNYANLNFRPVLHILYGIWLYAYNSKDYAIIQENWQNIKQYYSEFSYRELNLPSGLGAAIAMVRMSEIMNDAQMRQTCINQITAKLTTQGFLDAAKNFAYNGFNGWDAPYPYDTDRGRDLIFMGWIFLNISPEICRFLDDYYQQETTQHHLNEVQKYPLWWIRSVPYWSRWTGDESVGLPSEVCGMASPVERWVTKKNKFEFAKYTKSRPYCKADSHWLEMLIDAIELFGQTNWLDVRTYIDSLPPAAINDLRVEYFNSKAYLIWTTPSDNGLSGRPFNYWFKYSNTPIDDNLWNQYPTIPYNQSIKNAGEADTLLIPNLGSDSVYYIAVKSEDDFKNISSISNMVIFNNPLSVNEENSPKTFYVNPVYPNPFNPQTKISFYLPRTSTVNISVYSIVGELVDEVLNDKILISGEHSLSWRPIKLSSGIYFIVVMSKDEITKETSIKIVKSVLLK